MSMKSVVVVVLLVAAAFSFLQTGCNENRSTNASADNGAGAKERGWPVSAAPPDNTPRDLLRRCDNSLRDGNVLEYLACHRGNDPAYREAMVGAFKFSNAFLELRRAVEEHYGQGAWGRFAKLRSFLQPQYIGRPDWPTSGTMKWDGVSDEALWYEYDVPLEDQLPTRLRRMDGHWCFVMHENSTPIDAIVAGINEYVGNTETATEAARKGPGTYTLEQVRDVYEGVEP